MFIIGGITFSQDEACTTCIQYDTKTNEKKGISKMNQTRWAAASTTYEGKIVVSGGMFYAGVRGAENTKTVEVYDHIANTWTYMPNMVEERWNHSLVSIKSKLFVISRFNTGEVYDKATNKFTLIKPSTITYTYGEIQATSMGNKIVVFRGDESKVMFYDTDKDEWSEIKYDYLKAQGCAAFIKIPKV